MPTPRKRLVEPTEQPQSLEIDSKYRLIILAAKRSKQLQRGARPRINIDPSKHKSTRIALEEVIQGKIQFYFTTEIDPVAPYESSVAKASARERRGLSRLPDFIEASGSFEIPVQTALAGGLEGNDDEDIPEEAEA